jgi:gas vesicle protein
MLSRIRTAFKFLACGLLLGLLFAPRSGAETRRRAAQWMTRQLETTLGRMLRVSESSRSMQR